MDNEDVMEGQSITPNRMCALIPVLRFSDMNNHEVKGKVTLSLEGAMKARRGSRGIALLFL
jgi:hypothetical protein